VQNRPRTDESDAGDDLTGDARGISTRSSRAGNRVQHGKGQMGIQDRPDADQNIGAETGGFAAELALEPDRAAQQGGEPDLQHQLQPEHLDDLAKHS